MSIIATYSLKSLHITRGFPPCCIKSWILMSCFTNTLFGSSSQVTSSLFSAYCQFVCPWIWIPSQVQKIKKLLLWCIFRLLIHVRLMEGLHTHTCRRSLRRRNAHIQPRLSHHTYPLQYMLDFSRTHHFTLSISPKGQFKILQVRLREQNDKIQMKLNVMGETLAMHSQVHLSKM